MHTHPLHWVPTRSGVRAARGRGCGRGGPAAAGIRSLGRVTGHNQSSLIASRVATGHFGRWNRRGRTAANRLATPPAQIVIRNSSLRVPRFIRINRLRPIAWPRRRSQARRGRRRFGMTAKGEREEGGGREIWPDRESCRLERSNSAPPRPARLLLTQVPPPHQAACPQRLGRSRSRLRARSRPVACRRVRPHAYQARTHTKPANARAHKHTAAGPTAAVPRDLATGPRPVARMAHPAGGPGSRTGTGRMRVRWSAASRAKHSAQRSCGV